MRDSFLPDPVPCGEVFALLVSFVDVGDEVFVGGTVEGRAAVAFAFGRQAGETADCFEGLSMRSRVGAERDGGEVCNVVNTL